MENCQSWTTELITDLSQNSKTTILRQLSKSRSLIDLINYRVNPERNRCGEKRDQWIWAGYNSSQQPFFLVKKNPTDLLHASPNTILNKAFKHNLKVIKSDKTHASFYIKDWKK